MGRTLAFSLLVFVALIVQDGCGPTKVTYYQVMYEVTTTSTMDTVRVRVAYRDSKGFHTTQQIIKFDMPWRGGFWERTEFPLYLAATCLDSDSTYTITVTISLDDVVFKTDTCSEQGGTASVTGTVP